MDARRSLANVTTHRRIDNLSIVRRFRWSSTLSWLGAGTWARRIRTHDWRATPLGDPDGWPLQLTTLVSLLLVSPQPMFLAWGEQRTWLYNDAFTPILGNKHPRALGRPAMEVWAEAKGILELMFDRVFAGEPFYMGDFSLRLDRNGHLDEAHFSFSYSPVRDYQGTVVCLSERASKPQAP